MTKDKLAPISDAQVRQENNTVQGDQAGRDIIKPTYITTAPQKFCYMQNLIDNYKREVDQSPAFRDVIETLQHYISRMDKGAVVGLYTKLTLAGWDDDEIQEATRLKELFHKKLRSHIFSEYAQHILAHLLGLVYMNFKSHIPPLVTEGASRELIEAAVADKVIRPAMSELDENVLHLHLAEIQGALYFLTGNCHIKWH